MLFRSGVMENILENCCRAADKVRERCPLVHCITNYVTVNDVANCILAVGASPIMADDIAEAADITSISKALVIKTHRANDPNMRFLKIKHRRKCQFTRNLISPALATCCGADKYKRRVFAKNLY